MQQVHTKTTLIRDFEALGIAPGDGVFVHASMSSMGPVVGGARAVIEALQDVVGPKGLIGMPGFSQDACFPTHLDPDALSADMIEVIERGVLGHDPLRTPTADMGVIAESFRTWPGTLRSAHPAVSVCLNGHEAGLFIAPHSAAWATGADTPLAHLLKRESMRMVLIGVGWNRCSLLHVAEALAPHKRTKMRRFKSGPDDAPWLEEPDVADDLNRYFPRVGEDFEATGAVKIGQLGKAETRVCDYRSLLEFTRDWIDAENHRTGATE